MSLVVVTPLALLLLSSLLILSPLTLHQCNIYRNDPTVKSFRPLPDSNPRLEVTHEFGPLASQYQSYEAWSKVRKYGILYWLESLVVGHADAPKHFFDTRSILQKRSRLCVHGL